MKASSLPTEQKRQLEDYIHTNLHERITTPRLAATVHLSASRFHRVFYETYQCTPHQYVMDKRIERAKVLLKHSSFSQLDIALECGFATQSHFNREFTRRVGIPPGRYARD